MNRFRTILFSVILFLDVYMIAGIFYSIAFSNQPQIILQDHAQLFTLQAMSSGMILIILLSLLSVGLLLYNQFRPIFDKRGIAIIGFITLYSFFVYEETFLHGEQIIASPWLLNDYYIDYFGLYKVYLEYNYVQFFYNTWYMLIFHFGLLVTIGVLLYKGRVKHD